jgi:hypothetical protein
LVGQGDRLRPAGPDEGLDELAERCQHFFIGGDQVSILGQVALDQPDDEANGQRLIRLVLAGRHGAVHGEEHALGVVFGEVRERFDQPVGDPRVVNLRQLV